jgi:energy-coupling factor transporter ATP-binding protein EcfA2
MAISIRFDSVCFAYQRSTPVFINLNLELPSDKTILLTGENGLGKSTLAALAAGILTPQTGSVLKLHDKQSTITKMKPEPDLVLLRQNAADNLLGLTPETEMRLWQPALKADGNREQDMISAILRDWGLSSQRSDPVWELSSGQLRALALAGISRWQNKYWILDEPAIELDLHNLRKLQELIQQKQSVSRGMLIISHQTGLFSSLADLVLELSPQDVIRILT